MKNFCFEAMWLQDDSCRVVVENSWCGMVGTFLPSEVANKLKTCGVSLKSWEYSHFGNVSKQISKYKESINELQSLPPTKENLQELKLIEA